jgi:hypothetical protein
VRNLNLIRLAAIALAVASSGCSLLSGQSLPQYIPDTAGLMRSVEYSVQEHRFELDDGRVVTFPANDIHLGGTQPHAGTILLAGSQPVRWVYWADLRPADANLVPPGCYIVFGPATMNATHVFQTVEDARGDVIMVFPKTADWTNEGYQEGSDLLAGVGRASTQLARRSIAPIRSRYR